MKYTSTFIIMTYLMDFVLMKYLFTFTLFLSILYLYEAPKDLYSFQYLLKITFM
jgi:hypothetical protein